MLAVLELVSPLESPDFHIWKQTRTGLLSYPVDQDQAKAHLATSVFVQMALKPDIVHVVGYPEADHAVTGLEVIESCKMAKRAIGHALQSQIDMTNSKNIQQRVRELVLEAGRLIDAIRQLGAENSNDPLTDPAFLSAAVREGYLDAPQLLNNPFSRGEIFTQIDSRGACVPVDTESNMAINEENRIAQIVGRRD
ncbi:MAG: methionine synthase, partial [Thermoleophilia bacterium]|nr:methionine synthase [Thermoleophilia bacterium]